MRLILVGRYDCWGAGCPKFPVANVLWMWCWSCWARKKRTALVQTDAACGAALRASCARFIDNCVNVNPSSVGMFVEDGSERK